MNSTGVAMETGDQLEPSGDCTFESAYINAFLKL